MTAPLRAPALRGDGEPCLRRLPGLLAARPARARSPRRASSTCSPPSATGSSAAAARSCPGRSRSPNRSGRGRRPARLPDRGHRPGDRAALRAGGGGAGLGQRAARQLLLASRASSRPAPPGRSSSAAASASRRWLCCAAASPRAACRPGSCSASATRRTRGGLDDLFSAAEVGLASDDGHIGHHGYVTDLLAAMLEGDDAARAAVYACGPPAMLEAVAAAVRSARRRLRAGDGVADGLRLRRLLRLRGAARRAAATCASASTARSLAGRRGSRR